jgi:hypothetical protein
MMRKTVEIPREYEFTDDESQRLAEQVIRDSRPLIEALVDDE